jgi:hypothetical protein
MKDSNRAELLTMPSINIRQLVHVEQRGAKHRAPLKLK